MTSAVYLMWHDPFIWCFSHMVVSEHQDPALLCRHVRAAPRLSQWEVQRQLSSTVDENKKQPHQDSCASAQEQPQTFTPQFVLLWQLHVREVVLMLRRRDDDEESDDLCHRDHSEWINTHTIINTHTCARTGLHASITSRSSVRLSVLWAVLCHFQTAP